MQLDGNDSTSSDGDSDSDSDYDTEDEVDSSPIPVILSPVLNQTVSQGQPIQLDVVSSPQDEPPPLPPLHDA